MYAAGANTKHGKRRTHKDKRQAVLLLLQDKELATWSDGQIATTTDVSPDLVRKVRAEIQAAKHKSPTVSSDNGKIPSKKVKARRNGKVYKMNTAKIGKKKSKRSLSDEPTNPQEAPTPTTPVPDAATVPTASPQVSSPVMPIQPEATPLPPQPAEPLDGGPVIPTAQGIFSTDICKSGRCPDGGSHYAMNPVKKRMECDLIGIEITQLPRNNCAWIEHQKKIGAAVTTTSAAAEPIGVNQEAEEKEQILPEPIPQQLPLPEDENEVLAEQFIAACLAARQVQILDDVIRRGKCNTRLEAIGYLIDLHVVGTVTDTPAVDQPADPVKSSQEICQENLPSPSKPYALPLEDLLPEQWIDFFSDLVGMTFSRPLREIFSSLIAAGKFANEEAVLEFAITLLGKLEAAEQDIKNAQYEDLPSFEERWVPLPPNIFDPVFPVKRAESVNYPDRTVYVNVRSVAFLVSYISNGGGTM